MQVEDQKYWHLISEGNKEAFENVFRQHYSPLCHYANKLLKDPDEAEEVVQNLFYNMWVKRAELIISSSLKAYLFRSVHNTCLNKFKHGKIRTLYANDVKNSMGSGYSDSSSAMEAKELQTKIDMALSNLPEQCGKVFMLSRYEHLRYSEIAERLSISVKTVENHMGKALKLLREELKDYLHILLIILFLFS